MDKVRSGQEFHIRDGLSMISVRTWIRPQDIVRCYVARPDYQASTPFLLHALCPVLSYPLFIGSIVPTKNPNLICSSPRATLPSVIQRLTRNPVPYFHFVTDPKSINLSFSFSISDNEDVSMYHFLDRPALRASLSGAAEEALTVRAKRGLSTRIEQTSPLRGLLLIRARYPQHPC